jgi:hypothetical protein
LLVPSLNRPLAVNAWDVPGEIVVLARCGGNGVECRH